MRNKNKAGFTLIELLVVIAIIGLLASVVLLALNGARAKSRDAKRIADVRQLATAMELFFNDKSSYPTQAGSIPMTTYGKLVDLGVGNATAGNAGGLTPNYIGIMPSAPLPADGSCGSTGQGTNEYDYAGDNMAAACGSSCLTNNYTITFCLGAATGGYSAGPHTLTPAGIQ